MTGHILHLESQIYISMSNKECTITLMTWVDKMGLDGCNAKQAKILI